MARYTVVGNTASPTSEVILLGTQVSLFVGLVGALAAALLFAVHPIQTQAVLGFDDWNDIAILTNNNPTEANALNYRLVKAALDYLVEHCGLPQKYVDDTLLRLRGHKMNDPHNRYSFRDD